MTEFFRRVDYPSIARLRSSYLGSLIESQELYLELLVKSSDYYLIGHEEPIGYFILSRDQVLVEFYLTDASIPFCESVFDQLINCMKVRSAYCKSFDPLLLKSCLGRAASHRITGTLFRDRLPAPMFPNADCTVRIALLEDYDYLSVQKDGLYESLDELSEMLQNGNITMFHRDDALIGCGFLFKVTEEADFYDIGMWVNPEHRRQGYATMIISELIRHCLANGWTPICGCAADNTASRRTLEKNGYISRYDLIEFTF